MNKKSFHGDLLSWFAANKRSLPWRISPDWYSVWISEVMLQQTQVEQVIPYFLRFKEKFKNVEQLADASEEEVLKIWEGLGYYSRARNLHHAAKIIVKEHRSTLPQTWKNLNKLPGFGPYTTSAVLSIAFNHAHSVVDGNIKRVISRLYALDADIRKPATHKIIQHLMDSLLPPGKSARFNEAMMELGAMICQPTKPGCVTCPVSKNCQAFQLGMVSKIPFKSPKKKIPTRESVAFIFRCGDNFLLAKRRPEGMLAGMWEFPTLSLRIGDSVQNIEQALLSRLSAKKITSKRHWSPINHTYTHFKLILHPILLISEQSDFQIDGYHQYSWKPLEELKKLPLHKAIWKILDLTGNDLVTITD